jgi:hypothetical protein
MNRSFWSVRREERVSLSGAESNRGGAYNFIFTAL